MRNKAMKNCPINISAGLMKNKYAKIINDFTTFWKGHHNQALDKKFLKAIPALITHLELLTTAFSAQWGTALT